MPATAKKEPTEIEQLENLLSIDEENLPQEWHEQPRLYTRLSRYAARCHAQQAQAELDLKILEATIDETVRDRGAPENKRITERAIELAIRRHPDWQGAQQKRITRIEMTEIADALQKAAEMRERSLIRLSQRHLGGNLEDDDRLMTIVNKLVREQFQRLARTQNHHDKDSNRT